jgi:hypothetical protein
MKDKERNNSLPENNPEVLRKNQREIVHQRFFTTEETCPYGDAAFTSIEKCVTIYREEVIHQEIPNEVHMRLHQVIRRQWSMYYRRES